MNAMGHDVRTFIGVDKKDLVKKVRKLVPEYMPMGSTGMAEMGEMEMALPDNTLPMMTGFGQFGPIEMGGMFSVVKVREGLDRNDYKDPGWYKHPAGTVSREVPTESAALQEPVRQTGSPIKAGDAELRARKPSTGGSHSNH
jgi:hypothetical protein